jgi:hypothetical protein
MTCCHSFALLISRTMKYWASTLIFATFVLIFAQDSTNGGAHIVLDKNVPVPMRDGVILGRALSGVNFLLRA